MATNPVRLVAQSLEALCLSHTVTDFPRLDSTLAIMARSAGCVLWTDAVTGLAESFSAPEGCWTMLDVV